MHHDQHSTLKDRMNPFKDTTEEVPKFEFLAISEGKEAPVEFYYGTTEGFIEVLKKRLMTAYPGSFNVEIVDIDVLQKVIPPKEYDPEDFAKQYQEGYINYNPDAKGTVEDIEEPSSDRSGGEGDHIDDNGQKDSDEGADSSDDTTTETEKDTNTQETTAERDPDKGYVGDDSEPLVRPSHNTRDVEEQAVRSDGTEVTIDPNEVPALDTIDDDLLDVVALPDEVSGGRIEQAHNIDRPTLTDDGNILARPTLEYGKPVGAVWQGEGERKKDWMTTLKMFSHIAEPDSEDVQERAPLATLIQHLAESDLPIAYQVVFKRIENWSEQAEKRKDDLHLDRDTLGQKITYEIGELVHGSSQERRRERRRNPMEDMGESADGSEDSAIAGEIGKRARLIDNKVPKRTFRANIRAVSVATGDISVDDVKRTMDELASVLDHLDGFFYGLRPTIRADGTDSVRNQKAGTEEFHRFINREIVTASGKVRDDVIANADELANFLSVPSSKNLTVSGVRGTRAEPESRDPLPRPDPDLMKHFHRPGMRVGYALDKESDREPIPTQVPTDQLTAHYARFATTGAGKSKALINDMLSLHENSDGPTILIDPKGDGMPENYMRAHYERFGEENFKEKVIHFPVPDILPGFTFFNINPALENGKRRVDAVQDKADHYEELLKLVMGRERYRESKVAPIIIKSLIKSLFDKEHVEKHNQELHESEEPRDPNVFSHRDLEKATREMRKYGVTDGEKGRLPSPSDERVRETIEMYTEAEDSNFATLMDAVFNRLNYIRSDAHLRRIFDNTQDNFDFRNHLNDNKVILFDLGNLRDEATLVMTGLILTNLWDSLQESDRSKCTHGHEDISECKKIARENGLDENDPPCREPWNNDHLVNMIMDEAASVAVSDLMNKMLEQGRSFHLSVGLSMQFPEQMKSSAGDRVYRNVLNNVATFLIGKITLDEEIADAMAHENMSPVEFSNRIKALPRGEWIAQLPSPEFMETGPEPFSVEPLPIPSGHPESRHVLTEQAEERFKHFMDRYVHSDARNQYGIDRSKDIGRDDEDGGEAMTSSDTETNQDGNSSDDGQESIMMGGLVGDEDNGDDDVVKTLEHGSGESGSEGESNPTGDNPPLQLGDVAGTETDTNGAGDNEGSDESGTDGDDPFAMFGGGGNTSVEPSDASESDQETDTTEDTEVDTTEDTTAAQSGLTDGGGAQSMAPQEQEQTQTTTSVSDEKEGQETAIDTVDVNEVDFPQREIQHIAFDETAEEYICLSCRERYLKEDKNKAVRCCFDTLKERVEKLTQADTATIDEDNLIRSEQQATLTSGEEITLISERPEADRDDITNVDLSKRITSKHDLLTVCKEYNGEVIGAIASTLQADIPPQHQSVYHEIIDWMNEEIGHQKTATREPWFTTEELQQYIHEGDPIPINLDVEKLIESHIGKSAQNDEIVRWNEKNLAPIFRQHYNGRIPVHRGIDKIDTLSPIYGPKPDMSPQPHTGKRHMLTLTADDLPETLPIKRYRGRRAKESKLKEHGITRGEAGFLEAIYSASNGSLEGYELTQSMIRIKEAYGVNDAKLEQKGLIEINKLGRGGQKFYTITTEGMNVIDKKKQFGKEIGDLGDKTPHRVGATLIKEWYENHADGDFTVEMFVKKGNNVIDAQVLHPDRTIEKVVEIEGGKTNPEQAKEGKYGTHNYESIRKDAEVMKETGGDLLWVVSSARIGATILQALNSGGMIDIPKEPLKNMKEHNSIHYYKDQLVEAGEYDPNEYGDIITFTELWEMIKEAEEGNSLGHGKD